MSDKVTEKSLVEEQKRIKGAVDHKIKMQVEKNMQKTKLEKERRCQEVLCLHPQKRWILHLAKKVSGDKGAQTTSKNVIIIIVCLIVFI